MSSVSLRAVRLNSSPPATASLSLVTPDEAESPLVNGSPGRPLANGRPVRPLATNGAPERSSNGRPARRVDRGERKARMHRISTIRQREGVSLRSASRRMHVDIRRLRAQEDESADILLSTLYQWQQVLDVPLSELLVDSAEPLAPIVLQRARMVKVMKTVAAIRERSDSKPIARLVEMLTEQLLEIMPELKDVSPWHSVGQRRSANDYGRVVERRLPDDFFME
jgi:transcriptional regulator with XRE-family HTH domain